MALRHLLVLCLLWIVPLLSARQSFAFDLTSPEQTGIAAIIGSTYDPAPNFSFSQISLMALYDYEQIMPHPAPDPLRFKLEGSLGLTDHQGKRFIGSVNFFAHYTLERFETAIFRPYVEAGAGLVYGDFQVKNQGLRINFNPQAGIGSEMTTRTGQRYYGAIRAYHISNGGLNKDNRGLNGVIVQLGILF